MRATAVRKAPHVQTRRCHLVQVSALAILRQNQKQRKPIMPLLQSHIAVVTGAGSGIGRAIALGYAREGAEVAVLDVNGEAAAKTAADINGAGGKAQHFMLDVTDREACRAVAAEVAGRISRVSILVNNAGIVRRNGMTGP